MRLLLLLLVVVRLPLRHHVLEDLRVGVGVNVEDGLLLTDVRLMQRGLRRVPPTTDERRLRMRYQLRRHKGRG